MASGRTLHVHATTIETWTVKSRKPQKPKKLTWKKFQSLRACNMRCWSTKHQKKSKLQGSPARLKRKLYNLNSWFPTSMNYEHVMLRWLIGVQVEYFSYLMEKQTIQGNFNHGGETPTHIDGDKELMPAGCLAFYRTHLQQASPRKAPEPQDKKRKRKNIVLYHHNQGVFHIARLCKKFEKVLTLPALKLCDCQQ